MAPPRAQHGRLAVCPTPIGNLEDVTLRVLTTLSQADVIACEDTRRTRTLLRRHGIEGPLVSFHEHNERARGRELAARIAAGELVALVSDAGTPLVSDPGYGLLQECLQQGLDVEVLPGASAAVTALVASGLPPERWCFVGFLPRSRRERERVLGSAQGTLVAYESPHRLAATLALIAEREPERELAVCRELTKLHEEVRRGPAQELARHYAAHEPRGEVVLVCAAAQAGAEDRERALGALRSLVEAGARARPAAAAVASLSGHTANELYRALSAGPAPR